MCVWVQELPGVAWIPSLTLGRAIESSTQLSPEPQTLNPALGPPRDGGMCFQRKMWTDANRLCVYDLSEQELSDRDLVVRPKP